MKCSLATSDQDAIARRLNGVLGLDVRVRSVTVAPAGFHARFAALSRRYSYRVADHWFFPPRRHDTLAHPHPLDLDAMNAASTLLLGEHDFAAFCRRREGATTVRTLLVLEWVRDDVGCRHRARRSRRVLPLDGALVDRHLARSRRRQAGRRVAGRRSRRPGPDQRPLELRPHMRSPSKRSATRRTPTWRPKPSRPAVVATCPTVTDSVHERLGTLRRRLQDYVSVDWLTTVVPHGGPAPADRCGLA